VRLVAEESSVFRLITVLQYRGPRKSILTNLTHLLILTALRELEITKIPKRLFQKPPSWGAWLKP
jgi:hypothetical protein